jgi:DNA-directed RNA polymerase subunit L
VWLGTSDLTIKTNDTVDIRENPKEVIDNLIKNFEDIDIDID